MRSYFIIFSIALTLLICLLGSQHSPRWFFFFILIVPLIGLGIYEMIQTKHAIMRNFPLLGRGRYWMEWLRPKIYQYFVESDIDGRPFSRVFRTIVYTRAKDEVDTSPFGTQFDVYEPGYEWMSHSISPLHHDEIVQDPRVTIGNEQCSKPYSSSILNVSAMSFGSLSRNAVMAMNGGAKKGNFAQNTGEGGVSQYHLSHGGDLIWQIGTGYFGCRDRTGKFSPEEFKKRAVKDEVKMIELKLSQGAKPGHGGILPARKNTPEIAEIRGVEPHTDVLSPPYHTAFQGYAEMLNFIVELRNLSGGKPIGFKLCLGSKLEFVQLCETIVNTQIYPDFITIDGGEGGTGAAPLEFSNSVGMPMREGLAFAADCLKYFKIKQHIKLIASGKITTAFHLMRALALGADGCNSARAMMMAVGCIQALECNKNTCPTGVATQNESLMKGLHVGDKVKRVANYHHETILAFNELLAAAGLHSSADVTREMIHKRISTRECASYDEIYYNDIDTFTRM